MCELSCIGMRCTPHKPERLKHLSQQTGVNIVHATGFYCNKFLPESVHALSVAEMRDVMLKELRVGSAESDVRCGVIYLGCSWPLHTTEERALRAAAAVQAAQGNVVCTGCMSIIHVCTCMRNCCNVNYCPFTLTLLPEVKCNCAVQYDYTVHSSQVTCILAYKPATDP